MSDTAKSSAERLSPNSALFWLPKIEKAGLPTPRTVIVPCEWRSTLQMLDGHLPPDDLIHDLSEAIAKFRGQPIFLRTDLASEKHGGVTAYKVLTLRDLLRALYKTIEGNDLKFMFGPNPKAFLVREWLDLRGAFVAFGGHLIAREFRFFVEAGEVQCYHFYWPTEAIRFYKPTQPIPNWEEHLKRLAVISNAEANHLADLALQAAEALGGGAWSVDFAEGQGKKWWLIDIATAAESWHPDHEEDDG